MLPSKNKVIETSKLSYIQRLVISLVLKLHSLLRSNVQDVQKQLRQRFRHIVCSQQTPEQRCAYANTCQFSSRPNLSSRICFRSRQTGISGRRTCQQDTCGPNSIKSTWSFPQPSRESLTLISAKRRRALILPEEIDSDRRSPRHCSCWPCFRCSRPLQLHETAIPFQQIDLRPPCTCRAHRRHDRRSSTKQYTKLWQETIWCRTTCCRNR